MADKSGELEKATPEHFQVMRVPAALFTLETETKSSN